MSDPKAKTKARHAACRLAVMRAIADLQSVKVEGLGGFTAVSDLMRALPEWRMSALFEAIERLTVEGRLTSVTPHRARRPTHVRIKRKGAR